MSNKVSVFDLSFLQIVGLSAVFALTNALSQEIITPSITGKPSLGQRLAKIKDDCAVNPKAGSTLLISGKTYTVNCP